MPGKYVRSGDEGICACGTCHVPAYTAAMELLEQGLAVTVLVEEPGVLGIGYCAPSLDQLQLLMGDNRAVRGAATAAIARQFGEMSAS